MGQCTVQLEDAQGAEDVEGRRKLDILQQQVAQMQRQQPQDAASSSQVTQARLLEFNLVIYCSRGGVSIVMICQDKRTLSSQNQHVS